MTHFNIDLLAGIIIGAVSYMGGRYAAARAEKKKKELLAPPCDPEPLGDPYRINASPASPVKLDVSPPAHWACPKCDAKWKWGKKHGPTLCRCGEVPQGDHFHLCCTHNEASCCGFEWVMVDSQ